MKIDERIYPLESEKIVVGSILVRGIDGYDEACELVTIDCFYHNATRLVFQAIGRLADRNETIDLVNVAQDLVAKKEIDELGDTPMLYLADLFTDAGIGSNLGMHAKRVAESAKVRSVIGVINDALRDVHDNAFSADEIIAKLYASIAAIDQNKGYDGTTSIADAFKELVEDLDRRTKPGYQSELLPTGLPVFDQTLGGGFAPGELVIVAARPGRGKTAFLLQLARHLAQCNHKPVMFSLEMRTQENAARIMAAEAEVSSKLFRGIPRIDNHQLERISQAYQRLRQGPMAWINDRSDLTPSALLTIARRYRRKHHAGAILVDYLQLLRPTNPKDQRNQQVGEASRAMKLMARSLSVPVICAAQLNREVESRGDAYPRLSDLRDSGSLEQDADFVFFLHGNGEQTAEKIVDIELVAGKGRSVSAGYSLKLRWNKPQMTFEETM